MSEPTSQMRVLGGVHVLVDQNEHLSIDAAGGVADAVRVVQEVLVELLESLED